MIIFSAKKMIRKSATQSGVFCSEIRNNVSHIQWVLPVLPVTAYVSQWGLRWPWLINMTAVTLFFSALLLLRVQGFHVRSVSKPTLKMFSYDLMLWIFFPRMQHFPPLSVQTSETWSITLNLSKMTVDQYRCCLNWTGIITVTAARRNWDGDYNTSGCVPNNGDC